MRAAENWKDYELMDTSCGERLERWDTVTLIRPDPQISGKPKNAIPDGKMPMPGMCAPAPGAVIGK